MEHGAWSMEHGPARDMVSNMARQGMVRAGGGSLKELWPIPGSLAGGQAAEQRGCSQPSRWQVAQHTTGRCMRWFVVKAHKRQLHCVALSRCARASCGRATAAGPVQCSAVQCSAVSALLPSFPPSFLPSSFLRCQRSAARKSACRCDECDCPVKCMAAPSGSGADDVCVHIRKQARTRIAQEGAGGGGGCSSTKCACKSALFRIHRLVSIASGPELHGQTTRQTLHHPVLSSSLSPTHPLLLFFDDRQRCTLQPRLRSPDPDRRGARRLRLFCASSRQQSQSSLA